MKEAGEEGEGLRDSEMRAGLRACRAGGRGGVNDGGRVEMDGEEGC